MKKLKLLFAVMAFSLAGCDQTGGDGFILPGGKAEVTSARYQCDNGVVVTADYVNNESHSIVILGMSEKKILLADVVAASGSRYVGGELEWWAKGENATLSGVTDGKAAECKALK